METILEGKEYLRDNWSEGVHCPCCKQYVRLWKHCINSAITRTLIDMQRRHKKGQEWIHIMHDIGITTMYGIAEFWDLIEPHPKCEDGKRASGMWRLTSKGISFVDGFSDIPRYAYVFNNKVYDFSRDRIWVEESLGKKFNYQELLYG